MQPIGIIKISICIPVFSTEPFLLDCLRSAFTQNFDSFEILVVSDASRGMDEKGRNAKKIVRLAQKECNSFRKKNKLQPVQIRFIEHRENRGLIEVRRTLCTNAKGFYITQLDSDDQMEEGALKALYESSRILDEGQNGLELQNGQSGQNTQNKQFYDIVHGTSTAGTFDEQNNFIPAGENRFGTIFYGTIFNHDIFRRWLINEDFTANTWGKLIKRQLFIKAYENIPYTECNMADDLLLFFFLAQYAHSYIGIPQKVYKYRLGSGMTSHRKIDSIHKWKMICSAASVFTVISQWIEDSKSKGLVTEQESSSKFILSEDEIEKIRGYARHYIHNNYVQLKESVIPQLQEQAYDLLCDYWGCDFVQIMESALNKSQVK